MMSKERPFENASPIVLNFGASDFVQHAPGIPYEESIITIPLFGELPNIDIVGYEESSQSEPKVTEVQGLPAVVFAIPPGRMWTGDNEVMLIWIEKRKEWVTIWRDEWLESVRRGTNKCYRGPFASDDLGSQKILQAYEIPPDLIPLETVRKIGPEELIFLEERQPLIEARMTFFVG